MYSFTPFIHSMLAIQKIEKHAIRHKEALRESDLLFLHFLLSPISSYLKIPTKVCLVSISSLFFSFSSFFVSSAKTWSSLPSLLRSYTLLRSFHRLCRLHRPFHHLGWRFGGKQSHRYSNCSLRPRNCHLLPTKGKTLCFPLLCDEVKSVPYSFPER